MNNLNFDPGLRKAFSQQTHQRLLAESNQARLAKSVKTKYTSFNDGDEKRFSFIEKLKIISQLTWETGSEIITILRADKNTLNA